MQEIADHTLWMRRLACALVAESTVAEHVVQEAWIRLGRQRAQMGAGYLTAVVRSLAPTGRIVVRGDASNASLATLAVRALRPGSAEQAPATQGLQDVQEPTRGGAQSARSTARD